MHIPDGFLDTKTAVTTGLLSLSGLGTAVHHASRNIQSRLMPLVGLSAAFVFVAQMINFPVAAGTSGHLLGATLVAVLLGPSPAVIVMVCVLIIQALIFADGGILAIGANILNMAIVAPISGYGLYRMIHLVLRDRRGQLIAASVAAWFSTVMASTICAGELALSGVTSWSLAFPAMAGIHSLIGIGEGLITMLVLAAIGTTRPELLPGSNALQATGERRSVSMYGAIIILGLLILVVPFTSKLPDGLEKVAQTLGFEYRLHQYHQLPTVLQGYNLPGFASPAMASVVAGLVGAVVAFGLSIVLAQILVPKRKKILSHTPND